ncbi:hypothetical protein CEP73_020945 [Providencia stuartii]|nr:hypothetical protein CEP73_020945 [Providencia stuartii]
MSADQLKLLAYLEARNCAFLDIDTPSVQRKDQLTELAQRWLAQRLRRINEPPAKLIILCHWLRSS